MAYATNMAYLITWVNALRTALCCSLEYRFFGVMWKRRTTTEAVERGRGRGGGLQIWPNKIAAWMRLPYKWFAISPDVRRVASHRKKPKHTQKRVLNFRLALEWRRRDVGVALQTMLNMHGLSDSGFCNQIVKWIVTRIRIEMFVSRYLVWNVFFVSEKLLVLFEFGRVIEKLEQSLQHLACESAISCCLARDKLRELNWMNSDEDRWSALGTQS